MNSSKTSETMVGSNRVLGWKTTWLLYYNHNEVTSKENNTS